MARFDCTKGLKGSDPLNSDQPSHTADNLKWSTLRLDRRLAKSMQLSKRLIAQYKATCFITHVAVFNSERSMTDESTHENILDRNIIHTTTWLMATITWKYPTLLQVISTPVL